MKVVIAIFIYKITNNINGKIYIGQTVRSVESRFARHIRDAEKGMLDTHFARAIRKYGAQNFSIEVIDVANSQDELNLKEQYWIRHYDSMRTGYNETDALNKCGGNTYMSKTAEELNEIGEKIRSGKIGINNPNSRSVKCFNVNTGEELFFDTINECRKYFGENNHRFITTRVLHEICGLYRNEWKIAYIDDEYGKYNPKQHRVGKGVSVEDVETGVIEIFDSIREAARKSKIPRMKLNVKKFGTEFTVDDKYKITVLS